MQQDNHVTRREYTLHIAKMDAIMANGNYGSYDAYHWYKDRERKLAAKLTTNSEYDAMWFWHG